MEACGAESCTKSENSASTVALLPSIETRSSEELLGTMSPSYTRPLRSSVSAARCLRLAATSDSATTSDPRFTCRRPMHPKSPERSRSRSTDSKSSTSRRTRALICSGNEAETPLGACTLRVGAFCAGTGALAGSATSSSSGDEELDEERRDCATRSFCADDCSSTQSGSESLIRAVVRSHCLCPLPRAALPPPPHQPLHSSAALASAPLPSLPSPLSVPPSLPLS
eukprot:scaffold143174_cov33-Tisochrysis_lutea.AAC.1